MKQYHELLEKIMQHGVMKAPARAGMPSTKAIFGHQLRIDLAEGFPLLTTKRMYYKSIFTELIWFLRGDTNIKFLVDNNCNIWNDDAYRNYKTWVLEHDGGPLLSKDEYMQMIRGSEAPHGFHTIFGGLGRVYGAQWRNWGAINDGVTEFVQEGTDQLMDLIYGIRKNPFGRRHIITAWNPSEITGMALPPCHLLMQFNVRPSENGEYNILDCMYYMRSADTFLGVPFNIASYALLTHIIALFTGCVPGEMITTIADAHIYENHFDAVNLQLSRSTDTYELPAIDLTGFMMESADTFGKHPRDLDKGGINYLINSLRPDTFDVVNYDSYPAIKADLSVGI